MSADEQRDRQRTPDATHEAVIALAGGFGGTGGCTGTIVRLIPVHGRLGWVATAAHCVIDGRQGSRSAAPTTTSRAASSTASSIVYDSRFDPGNIAGGYDFAIVRIAGVDAATPVIPLALLPRLSGRRGRRS